VRILEKGERGGTALARNSGEEDEDTAPSAKLRRGGGEGKSKGLRGRKSIAKPSRRNLGSKKNLLGASASVSARIGSEELGKRGSALSLTSGREKPKGEQGEIWPNRARKNRTR